MKILSYILGALCLLAGGALLLSLLFGPAPALVPWAAGGLISVGWLLISV